MALGVLGAFAGIGPTRADDLQTLRTRMLEDLSDPQASFDFARAAAESGDVEGAIAALERMLLIEPALANIRLELGLLYLQTGADELAQLNLEAALAAPDITPAARDRALQLLGRARRAASPHSFSGVANLGVRYESNANAGPEGRDVFVFGFLAPLSDDGRETEDASLVGSASARYAYRPGPDARWALEADGDFYVSAYRDRDDLNFQAGVLTLGPRFYLGQPSAPRASVRPFVSGVVQRLGGENYLEGAGGGFNVQAAATPRLLLDATVARQNLDYQNSPRRFVEDRSGDQTTASLSVSYAAAPRLQLGAGLNYARADAEIEGESFDRYGAAVSAVYALPIAAPAGPVTVSAQAAYSDATYDGPDPTVDPRRTREDRRTDLTLAGSYPLTKRLALGASLQSSASISNLANFKYRNESARLELQWRF